LLDFGIAKVRRTEVGHGETTTRLSSTDDAGTPAYMAPEVLRGNQADRRSDLFSLGVVLYESLTGVSPFPGTTPHEIWGRVLHVEPAPPSRLNPTIPPELDEVCQRLLAKDPLSRFPAAGDVRRALESLATTSASPPAVVVKPRRSRTVAAVVAALVLVVAGWWAWRTLRDSGPTLPRAPAAAEIWYERGIEAIRQGAYVSARRALAEAVRIFPEYALAHSRLAEVHAALDDERSAQASLIRVSVLLPDQTRLATGDRLRLDATRAMVLREVDGAIAAYTELAKAQPQDAGALIDLGRAHESAGQLTAARDAYERAIHRDNQSASAFLRLGSVSGELGALPDALRAFDEAERLYTLASNVEGRVETLLQRATKLDGAGRSAEAVRAAETALQLATQAQLLPQELTAQFIIGSALVGRGDFAKAEAHARNAVDRAIAEGLETIAAEGLIDMAGTLLANERAEECDQALERAARIAADRGLTRTAMRAATQRASLRLEDEQPREALTLLDAPLKYFESARDRRLEALALTIAGRAHQQLGEYAEATALHQRVLAFATASRNGELTAQARSSLATLAASEGRLVEAVEHRAESIRLSRQLGSAEVLPYDLTNQAEALTRLGRRDEAERLLDELEAGIASGAGAFPSRRRRVTLLRALLAYTAGQNDAARKLARAVDGNAPLLDEPGQMASALSAAAAAQLGSRNVRRWQDLPDDPAQGWREVRLWRAIADLDAGRAEQAEVAAAALRKESATRGGPEFLWRLSAVTALAIDKRDGSGAAAEAARSLEQFETFRSELGQSSAAYERRADVSRLLSSLRGIVARTRDQLASSSPTPTPKDY
jgi:tetratricopeptide (TPR) repeat protein